MTEKICIFADRCKIEDCKDCTSEVLERFRDTEILNNAKVGDEIKIDGVKLKVESYDFFSSRGCINCYLFHNEQIHLGNLSCNGKIFLKVNN